jgi:hypothetical protein
MSLARPLKRLSRRLDAWAERSRLNPYRLLVMPHPHLTEADRAAFERLLAATPDGGDVAYDLERPKWWFLHHAIRSGLLLHGTNEHGLEVLGTRANDDARGAPVDAVFASDDAIWPLYFATADRRGGTRGLINWCEHRSAESRYLFALEGAPSWTAGTVYALPAETFEQTPASRELVSFVPVRPRLRVPVTPEDFPLRDRTIGFRRGESVRRVALRHALRLK